MGGQARRKREYSEGEFLNLPDAPSYSSPTPWGAELRPIVSDGLVGEAMNDSATGETAAGHAHPVVLGATHHHGRSRVAHAETGEKKRLRKRRIAFVLLLFLLVAAVAAGGWLLLQELTTSEIQARWIHRYASKMTFTRGEGPADRAILAPSGPYDRRMGYSSLPVFTRNLMERGFHISRQARVSEEMWDTQKYGVFPNYREKTQAGLRVIDRNGLLIFHHPYPTRIFRSFSDIPPVIVQMLLFVENRMLLDEQRPMMNPAVEWERFGKAVTEKVSQWIYPDRSASGGSTLATQLEKFRHSESGITDSVGEKIRQMASASLRAYREGENTLETRRRIVLDYLNSDPSGGSARIRRDPRAGRWTLGMVWDGFRFHAEGPRHARHRGGPHQAG